MVGHKLEVCKISTAPVQFVASSAYVRLDKMLVQYFVIFSGYFPATSSDEESALNWDKKKSVSV